MHMLLTGAEVKILQASAFSVRTRVLQLTARGLESHALSHELVEFGSLLEDGSSQTGGPTASTLQTGSQIHANSHSYVHRTPSVEKKTGIPRP